MKTPDVISDLELLERLRQDDVQAFERLYRRYASELFHTAFHILRDATVCEDIIQELFIALWTKRHGLAVLSLKSYLYRAVRNNVLKVIRSNRVQVELEHLERLCSDQASSDRVMVRELQDSLDQGLEQLPERCRIIFEMSRFQQLSHKEIATQLNISVKTVESQITIALKRLKVLLRDFVYLFLLFLWW